MTDSKPDLSDLRQEIDDVDSALHDLLMRRATIVEKVKAAKTGDESGYYRPGREAEVLRRLADRHEGILPRAVVIRIWRELMSAFVGLQGPFSCAVWDSGDGVFPSIARDHFGTAAAQTRYPTPVGVLHAVSRGDSTVGVLPAPQLDDADPWWPLLFGGSADGMTICGLIPFDTIGKGPSAFVLARVEPEETGDDRTVVVLDTEGGASRGRLSDILRKYEMPPVRLTPASPPGRNPGSLCLAEVEGFVAADDQRLARMVDEEDAIIAARIIGAYPAPLEPV